MPSGSELQVLLGNVVVAQLSGDLSQPVPIGHRSGDKVVFCLRRPFHGR